MATAPLKSVTLNYLQLQPEGDSTGLPQVVLIHGLAANLSFWYFSIAPLLAEVAQVTLLDLRGHGRSAMPPTGYQLANMAEDIAQLLDYLKLDRPHLVGHSLGGSVMAHFASRYPQKPASLTFADVRLKLFQPAMTLADWPQWKTYRALLNDLGVSIDSDSRELGYQLLLEMARLHLHNPERGTQLQSILPSSLFAGFAFAGKGGKRAAQQLLNLLEKTTAIADLSQETQLTVEQLQAVTCPVLAVYGDRSQTLPTLTGIERAWPNLTKVIVANAGHFFPSSQPTALLTPLLEFLLRREV
ncbi:MAG: hypothetical protein DCF15_13015 [Phormidesmis priestleyi]|uniref:AB hydrolase-1 domain-containing protein n=1 Tax=Phormidesmis priestleyi TaxID=268141 RepID=A0A2W4X855_9CYAN|nr:MAG: hypothetical protein DCF15_13015 [Phormidesmis priestleyi]